ncbi:MAG: hypothetical protein ACLUCH_08945, partial [Lachnospirales bacterium]
LIGTLNKDEYLFIKDNYLEKIRTLIKNKENLENELINLENDFISNKCFDEFSKFDNIGVLTKELIQNFIYEIIIYEDKTIQIKFKYKNAYY